jgi:putative peptidoglycan lipid II flippase
MTARALIFYALGLPFFSLNLLFTRAFYSRGDTKTPVKISLIAVFSNVGLDLLLVRWMNFGGLALASSLAAGLNSFLLILFLNRSSGLVKIGNFLPGKWVGKILTQVTVFALFCQFLQGKFYSGGEERGLFSLIGIIILVSGFYLLLTFLLQLEEGKAIIYLFHNRRSNTG